MRVQSVAGAFLVFLMVVSIALAGSQPGLVEVASGDWDGYPWSLRALDSESGSYCTSFSLAGHIVNSGCGTIDSQPASLDLPHGLSWEATNGHGATYRPNYVLGLVVASAKSVHITLSNGAVINTRIIAPPPGLTRKVAFYAAEKPCGPYPVSITARNRAGRVVASWNRRVSPPPLPPGPGHPNC